MKKCNEEILLRIIELALRRLERCEVKQVRFSWGIGPVQNKPTLTPRNKIMDITINNEQQVPVFLKPVTPSGHPATLDGAPTWEVISGDSTVTAAEDGLSAMLVSGDNPGDTEFLVKADADLGSGVVEISDIIRLTVTGAQAASMGLTAGQAEPKP